MCMNETWNFHLIVSFFFFFNFFIRFFSWLILLLLLLFFSYMYCWWFVFIYFLFCCVFRSSVWLSLECFPFDSFELFIWWIQSNCLLFYVIFVLLNVCVILQKYHSFRLSQHLEPTHSIYSPYQPLVTTNQNYSLICNVILNLLKINTPEDGKLSVFSFVIFSISLGHFFNYII